MTLAIALSRGDPSGIGIEIALKAWISQKASASPTPFFLVADIPHTRQIASDLGIDIPIEGTTPADAASTFAGALPIVPMAIETHGRPGLPDIADAPGTIASMERCAELVAAGEASSVVTLPISKAVLHRVGYPYPGQTEFMGAMAEKLYGTKATPVMLLWSPILSVVPATIHLPIAHVPSLITTERIEETIRIIDHDFRARFGLSRPRIAVAGLNPHAGESGDIGQEEIDTIIPALEQLRSEGLAVTGPHPADTLFHEAARATYDVVVTMYHDQALIPIKTLAFDSAVNVTLGLPFVRTSPDHGTAFDIAGKGVANPSSLLAALQLAARLAAAAS